MPEPLANTKSVCPVCLRVLAAERELRGDEAWLVKQCPEHGLFETLIWKGPPDIREWSRPKTPYQGGPRKKESSRGCPWDCGLCARHNQRTCTAVLEITARCDLGCPVCFASSGQAAPPDPTNDQIKAMLKRVWEQTGGCNLQFSGGEPTMRDDLPELVEEATKAGFSFVQLNTNGLKLAADPDICRRLAGAGLSSLFLQFDGLRASDHLTLRGRDLTRQKLEAMDNAIEAGLGVVLVPTIKAWVNQDQLWDLVKFGMDRSPGVRGVHFQPMAFFGRYPKAPDPRSRITLPQIMQGLQEQSHGKIKAADFSPPGCEHSLCSFSARYVVNPNINLTRLGMPQSGCCPPPARGARGTSQHPEHRPAMVRADPTGP
jgi:uncharacterized radical SAM superfamily Fe-S cluster-containing enzyme